MFIHWRDSCQITITRLPGTSLTKTVWDAPVQPEVMADMAGKRENKMGLSGYSPVFRSLGGTLIFRKVLIPGALPAGWTTMRVGACLGGFCEGFGREGFSSLMRYHISLHMETQKGNDNVSVLIRSQEML